MATANDNPARSTRRNAQKHNEWLPSVVDLNPRQQRLVERALRVLERSAIYRAECFTNHSAVRDYLRLKLAPLDREVFVALWLDAQNRLIEVSDLSTGTLKEVVVYPREVVKAALARNAAAVIFAHNHPSGVPDQSRGDEMLTNSLKEALALVDVKVLDHFIVAGNAFPLSFAERGLL